MQNNSLYDALRYKMNLAEKRLANAKYNVWLYREALQLAEKRKDVVTHKKIEQLEMFTA
jgi:hypothetical protein